MATAPHLLDQIDRYTLRPAQDLRASIPSIEKKSCSRQNTIINSAKGPFGVWPL